MLKIESGTHFIERHPTSELYKMEVVNNSFNAHNEDLDQITEVCNEALVYDIFFKDRFHGRPYSPKDALNFINSAKYGFKNRQNCVFLIRDPEGKVVGVVDLKKREQDSAQVGYWVSSRSPGVMTNAVETLCSLAQNSGIRRVYGTPAPDNKKSQKVLLRAGFVPDQTKSAGPYLKFVRKLAKSNPVS